MLICSPVNIAFDSIYDEINSMKFITLLNLCESNCFLYNRMTSKIPKMFVFDLDGCVWEPEMYEIWGGGSPFKTQKNGNVKDCKGQEVYFLGDVRKILYELHTDSKYADSIVGVASTCDGKE
jgi:hypothetical protein